jgi:hypothetical protein
MAKLTPIFGARYLASVRRNTSLPPPGLECVTSVTFGTG